MARSRQKLINQDSSLSPTAARSRELDGPSRWADYLGPDVSSPVSSTSSRNLFHDGQSQGNTPSSQSGKGLNMQWVVQLTEVAEGLMAKMYRLNQLLDYPDPVNHVFSDGFWKAGVFPNHPRVCVLLSKKFPEHSSKLQIERVRSDV